MDCLYKIINISLYVKKSVPFEMLDACWASFSTRRGAFDLVDITFICAEYMSIDYLVECYSLANNMCQAYRYGSDVLLANQDFSICTMLSPHDPTSFSVLSNQVFYTHAARRNMLQLHCATVDDQGRGILFLGPSGIGKTTQAERWVQYRGSSIINGDIGLVQRTDDGYVAWGTPWHGSSPYCLNACVPVKALVVLKQAPENRLRELTGFEKVSEVSGSVFYPTWLENGMELCTDTLNHLLTALPVYRLDNRADEEAVNLLAAELDRIS